MSRDLAIAEDISMSQWGAQPSPRLSQNLHLLTKALQPVRETRLCLLCSAQNLYDNSAVSCSTHRGGKGIKAERAGREVRTAISMRMWVRER